MAAGRVDVDAEILAKGVADAAFFENLLKGFDCIRSGPLENYFAGAWIVADEIDVIKIRSVSVGLDEIG